MADWGRGGRVTHTVEYTIPAREPWGACWNQVQQAVDAAIAEYCRVHGLNGEPADDAVRVHVTDDSVVISFEVKGTAAHAPEAAFSKDDLALAVEALCCYRSDYEGTRALQPEKLGKLLALQKRMEEMSNER